MTTITNKVGRPAYRLRTIECRVYLLPSQKYKLEHSGNCNASAKMRQLVADFDAGNFVEGAAEDICRLLWEVMDIEADIHHRAWDELCRVSPVAAENFRRTIYDILARLPQRQEESPEYDACS